MIECDKGVGLTTTKTCFKGNDAVFGHSTIEGCDHTGSDVAQTVSDIGFFKEGCRVGIDLRGCAHSHITEVGGED